MPVFAEQSHNAKMVLALKIGRVLNKYTFTAETVYSELKQVIFCIYKFHVRQLYSKHCLSYLFALFI